jgi:hypothetical protein
MNVGCCIITALANFTIVIGEILNVVTSDKAISIKSMPLGGMHYGAIQAVEILQEGR